MSVLRDWAFINDLIRYQARRSVGVYAPKVRSVDRSKPKVDPKKCSRCSGCGGLVLMPCILCGVIS